MRIGRHQLFINIAREMAKRSTCFRLNVGAVVTSENNLVSCGYNGAAPGEPHCQGNDCPLSDEGGCISSLHAESNDKVGEESVFEALKWERGIWSVDPVRPEDVPPANIERTIDSVLIQGCHLVDQQKRKESMQE